MHPMLRVGILTLVLLVTGCTQNSAATSRYLSPTPEEMRQSLLQLLREYPAIACPEGQVGKEIPVFRESLMLDSPVTKDGMVYIGVWNCDPRRLSFEALYSGPNITMYEISGRFELDHRNSWHAIPLPGMRIRNQQTRNRDVTEFWRPHEALPRF
jgi:hypothetical protein